MSRDKDPTALAKTETPALALTATAQTPLERPAGPAERASLERGARIGKYTVLELLGEGGMGVVYAAYDPDLDRKVGLKLLRAGRDQAARARFLREAQAMARITHPNVITVYEVGTVDGRDFIAMEFVDGGTLGDWVEAEERSTAAILAAFSEAGRGLAAAHDGGLVHRDFKPANVLVDADGRVRVTDFGLARRTDDADDVDDASSGGAGRVDDLTRTGAVMGTPAYMAPEQHAGEVADARSDQFAFAVALYEALYRERPFAGDGYEELRASVTEGRLRPPPSEAEVPPELRRVLARALAVDPAERYASMAELLDALQPAPRRSRRRVLALAAAGLALAGIGVAAVDGGDDEAPAALCAAGASQIHEVWGGEARGRVRTAFAMAPIAGSLASFELLEGVLDDYAADWAGVYRAACEESRADTGASADDLLLRMQCLQERRGALGALVSALEQIDGAGVEAAVEAAHQLPPISACEDLAALRQGVTPPDDAVRAEVAALRQTLDEAASLGEVGQVDDATAKAEAVRADARELGYAPLVAESLNVLGELYWKQGRVSDSEEAYTEAEFAAEEAGHDEARAVALLGMTRLLATSTSRFEEAERYVRRARAAAQRSPARRDELLVELGQTRARIASQRKRPEEAIAILEDTLRSLRLTPLGEMRVAAALAEQHGRGGAFEAWRDASERALSIAERELGDAHPTTAGYLADLSLVVRLLGDEARADALEQRARRFWDSDRGREILEQGGAERPAASRRIEGVVVDADGRPAAGASVIAATVVQAGSVRLDPLWSTSFERAFGLVRAVADDRGRFTLEGAPDGRMAIVAQLGRERAAHMVVDPDDPTADLRLTVGPPGGLRGRVLRGGAPAGGLLVSAMPEPVEDPPAMAALVATDADGRFELDVLAPGGYRVLVAEGLDSASAIDSAEVEIVAGEIAVLEVGLDRGTGVVDVVVRGEGGAAIPSAQLLLLAGDVPSGVGAAINELVLGGVPTRSVFWTAGEEVAFDGIRAGRHSVCVIPLAGDFRNPEYARELDRESVLELPVHCRPVDVVAGERLEVVAEVPPLQRGE